MMGDNPPTNSIQIGFMKCERCQEREATVFIISVADSQMSKESLCQFCASQTLESAQKYLVQDGWTYHSPNAEIYQTVAPIVTLFDLSGRWQSAPGISIKSISHLSTLLTAYARNPPGVLELRSAFGAMLQMGIGGDFASARFIDPNSELSCLYAAASPVRASKAVEILLGGAANPVPPRFCISFDEVLRIAQYFFLTGGHDPSIEGYHGNAGILARDDSISAGERRAKLKAPFNVQLKIGGPSRLC